MSQVSLRRIIDATPEEVFGLYTDLDRRAEWNPAARGLLEQTGPLNEAGSRYVMDTRFGPFEVHLLRVEPPRIIEMIEGVGRSGETHVTMHFDRLSDGRTRISTLSTFEPRGRLGRLTAPVNAVLAWVYGLIELRRLTAVAERTSSRRG